MSNIAEFIQRDPQSIDVMIGTHVVGKIRMSGKKTHYSFTLPGHNLKKRRLTDSVHNARRQSLHILSDWFAGLGTPGAAASLLLLDQAERERGAI